jgi:GMP synthase-like glutamine amidotransferase
MVAPTRSLYVIQHTDSEFLGLMEDHLEGRGIRFAYMRPHTAKGRLPATVQFTDGIVLLGGGLWGSAGSRDLPTLAAEIDLTRQCLARGVPVIGIGLGAQILALAAGGGSEPAEPAFSVGEARRSRADALNGYLPDRYPLIVFMRDRPLPPRDAPVLAVDAAGRPALFQVGANAFGFIGHPGAKPAMIEDLAMEFGFWPDTLAQNLDALRNRQPALEDALVGIMTGLVQITGWMQPKPLKSK